MASIDDYIKTKALQEQLEAYFQQKREAAHSAPIEQLQGEFYDELEGQHRAEASARSNKTKAKVLDWSRMAHETLEYLDIPKEHHAELFCALLQSFGTARLIEKLSD